MSLKVKSIFVSCMLILSVLLIAGNLGFTATLPENGDNEPVAGEPRQAPTYHWGDIFVVSEPIVGQDWNIDYSDYPDIAVENGKIYVVWQDDTNYQGSGTDSDIFYRHFDGDAWSEFEVISEPDVGLNNNFNGSFDSEIAVDNGNVYVIWHDYTDLYGSGGDSDIFYRCNRGSGWEDIQVISEPVFLANQNSQGSHTHDLAVENGKVYAVWYDFTSYGGSGSDSDIFFRTNLTGTGWEDIQVISEPVLGADNNENSNNPNIDVENGNIYVVWNDVTNLDGCNIDVDVFYRCNRSGSGWEDIQIISEPTKGGDQNDLSSQTPVISVDNSKLYVVWYDYTVWDNSGTDSDIFYRCNISGNSWETMQIISEPVAGADENFNYSRGPDIEAEDNNIYVVWHDTNETYGSDPAPDIFYKCNFSGQGWEKVQIISEQNPGPKNVNTRGMTLGSAFPSIAVENGKSHVVWYDTDGLNGAGEGEPDIFYRCTFFPPVLSTPSVTPVSGNTNMGFNFTVTYSDIDNEVPTVMVLNISNEEFPMMEANPADTNYCNGKSYYYNTTLNIGESYSYYFRCFDSYYYRTTTPVDVPDVLNTPPNILTVNVETATEEALYEVDYEYEDIDLENVGQVGTWSIQTDAGWLNFNATSGVLSGTPTQTEVGFYGVNITINDTIDQDWTNFTIEVENVNDPPMIITDMLPFAQEDEFYELDFEAEDVDSPILSWMIVTNADWLVVNNSQAKINGTPKNDDVGAPFWVNVSVDDGQYSDNKNYSLMVNNKNDPPRIITETLPTAITGEPYSVILEAEDIDPIPQMLAWSMITDAGAWLKLNSTSGQLYGTPGETDAGEFSVNISVNDGFNGTDTKKLNLKVELGIDNLAPTITTDDVTYAVVNESYSVIYEATDDHTDLINLTWTWTSNAGWLDFNATSQELSGTPAVNDIGEYWVNISVSDEGGLSTYHNFTITVSTIPPNNEPELSGGQMSPASGDSDTTFTFTVTYTDEDDDPGEVSVWIDGKEHKMTPDPSDTDYTDGVDYTYKTKLGEGEHDYYFIADDGELDAVPTDTTPTSSTDAETTPSITEAKGDDKEAGEGDENWWIWVLLTFIVMLILVFVAFAIGKRSGAAQAYGPPSEEAPPAEEESEEDWEDEDKDVADEEMDEEMEDEEDWEDEAKDEDEDIDETETEDEAEEEWDKEDEEAEEDWDEE